MLLSDSRVVGAANSAVVVAVALIMVVVSAAFDVSVAVVDGDGAVAPAAEAKSSPFSDSSGIIPCTVMKGRGA